MVFFARQMVDGLHSRRLFSAQSENNVKPLPGFFAIWWIQPGFFCLPGIYHMSEDRFMDKKKIIGCPGCLLRLPDRNLNPDVRFNASGECSQLYYEITYYTLSKNDPGFIHQLVVDAYAAQHTGERTRTITNVFALVGLYLATEKGYTGKQVQKAHMKIARVRKDWPRLEPRHILRK